MADKRMFSRKLISSDAFLDMPLTAQGLFFHLCMRADDDGFVDSPNRIVRECQATKEDLNVLLQKRYILSFPSGVVVIKHWKMHNTIAKDRYTPTVYIEEMSALSIKDNKSYTERKQNDSETEHREDKKREEEESKEKNIMCNADANALFERLWQIYPNKRGKGQISLSKKRRLLDIGFEELERALYRYKADLEENPWKKTQNGSTFFNSGYIDYLDANYEEPGSKVETEKQDEPYKFACLEPEKLIELQNRGIISGQSIDLGNATEADIRYLSEKGVL